MKHTNEFLDSVAAALLRRADQIGITDLTHDDALELARTAVAATIKGAAVKFLRDALPRS